MFLRILLLFSWGIMAVSLVSAQKTNYGFTIGSNYSLYTKNITTADYLLEAKPAMGYSLGFYANEKLQSYVMMQMGINYMVKSSRYHIIKRQPNGIDSSKNWGNYKQGYIQGYINVASVKKKHLDFFCGIFLGRRIYSYGKTATINLNSLVIDPIFHLWDNGLTSGLAYKTNHFRLHFDISASINTNLMIHGNKLRYRTASISIIYLLVNQE